MATVKGSPFRLTEQFTLGKFGRNGCDVNGYEGGLFYKFRVIMYCLETSSLPYLFRLNRKPEIVLLT